MLSPYGEEFRGFLDLWDKQAAKQKLLEQIEDKKNKIKALLDGGPMLLFMKNKDSGDIFGADEPSRVVFARMKNPSEDESEEWVDNASFMATNLHKLLNGEEGHETVFGNKDMKHLDVMDDKDDLIEKLIKGMKGGGGKSKIVVMQSKNGEPGQTQFDKDFQEL